MGKDKKRKPGSGKVNDKCLFVRNLPFTFTNEQLTDVYKEYGPIGSAYIVNDSVTKKSRGIAFVKFTDSDDAKKALEAIKSIEGRRLTVSFAETKKPSNDTQKTSTARPVAAHRVILRNIPFNLREDALRTLICDIPEVSDDLITSTEIASGKDGKKKGFALVAVSDKEVGEKIISELNDKLVSGRQLSASWFLAPSDFNKSQKTAAVKVEKEVVVKKEPGMVPVKPMPTNKPTSQHRVIIRNLPFKACEDSLKKQLKVYGEVVAVDIPTKPDGKKRGFAFISLSTHDSAQRIVSELKTVDQRPVAVDWAVDKDKYQNKIAAASVTVKSEPQTVDKVPGAKAKKVTSGGQTKDVKAETTSDQESGSENSDNDSDSNKSEEESDNDDDPESSESQSEGSDSEMDQSDGEEESGSEEEDSDEDDESESDEGFNETENKKKAKTIAKKKHETTSADINQERTLFLRNVGYDTTEAELSELFSQFGDVAYVKVLMDPVTERSKGMAFVQYKKKTDSDKCIEATHDQQQKNTFFLGGRDLNVTLAISRERVGEINQAKEKQPKDKRNLYLAREGLIRDGTIAAEGVSKQDMIKRNKLVSMMQNKLKNSMIFISPVRICVHNLPVKLSDQGLKAICFKAAQQGKAARIVECRIMRDLSKVNEQGIGRSRAYGFVAFTEHQHALACLRNLNNNPETFTNEKRPIVEFSLENTKALQAKEKRLQTTKSMLSGNTKGNVSKDNPSAGVATTGTATQIERPAGVKPGLPSHSGPKVRHKPRPATAADPKREAQKARKRKEMEMNRREKEANKQPKPKQRKYEETDSFDKLVDKYRNNMASTMTAGKAKSKWYN